MKKHTTLQIRSDDSLYAAEVKRFRELMIEAVRPFSDHALFFSAGTDSTTILAALLALGSKPICYSFSTQPWDNSDRQTAEAICNHFGLTLVKVDRERTEENLLTDLIHLISKLSELENWNPKRTTVIQCCHVTYRLCLSALSQGDTRVLMGTGGVNDDTRACAIAYREGGDAAALPLRQYTISMARVPLEQEVNPINAEHWLAHKMGVMTQDVYGSQALMDYILSLPNAVVNYPRMKGIALRAFPEFWSGHELWYQDHNNMHVNCGMREWHNTLVDTKLNRYGYVRTPGIYSDLVSRMRAET